MKGVFALGLLVVVPGVSWGCACGCGVFDVGTRSLFPTGAGGTAYLEYNYMDQSRNWSGAHRASEEDNPDKAIRTDYFTLGTQYMFNRDWGVLAQVPFEHRSFITTDESGNLQHFTHSALGDIRIKALYAGFAPDMSSGVTLGLQLPTGDYTYPHFDKDTEIGTGSTDVLLGGYLRGQLPLAERWDWFLTAQLDQPALTQSDYHPGSEINAVAGVYYNGWRVQQVKIAPVLQAVGAYRWRDHGSASDPDNTGYERLLLAPGLEFDIGQVALYGDVAFPLYQDVNGNQLVAPELFTVRVSYNF